MWGYRNSTVLWNHSWTLDREKKCHISAVERHTGVPQASRESAGRQQWAEDATISYLFGCMIDHRLSWLSLKEYLAYASGKRSRTAAAVLTIMANTRTPRHPGRWLLVSVVQQSPSQRVRDEQRAAVEYLKGKDNYVADALSKVTITELKKYTNKQYNSESHYQKPK